MARESGSPEETIEVRADQAGIQLLGIADARIPQGVRGPMEEMYARWLDEGNHGTMTFLQRHREMKFDPERILPGCRSVILAALPYYQEASWGKGRMLGPRGGRISRYAWGRDYHKVLKTRLNTLKTSLGQDFPGEEFLPFTDAGPLHERFFAQSAGIGFTGRHTLLITHEQGSWVFLGGLLTTLALEARGHHQIPENPGSSAQGVCPSSCRRCIQVCPTGALTAPFRIDASRCISYLTIEHRGLIPEDLRSLMGDWVFGCDLCQEVCPLNLKAQQTGVEDFLTIRAQGTQDLGELLSMRSHEDFVRRFAGTPVMRARREGMVRNACIAGANRGEKTLIPILREVIREDSDAAVRETARWAVAVLEGRSTGSQQDVL